MEYFTQQIHIGKRFIHSNFMFVTSFYCRRREYYIHDKLERGECRLPQANNLNSIRHVRISSTECPRNSTNSFSNVTELTIDQFLNTSDRSYVTHLYRMLPLKRLDRLNIEHPCFPLDDMIQLLSLTRNIRTLTIYFPYIDEDTLSTVEQNPLFQGVSRTNQIRYVYSPNRNIQRRRRIPFLLKLFPRMEYLHLSIDRKEITEILSDLFGKQTNRNHRLVFLCFSGLPRMCLHEVDQVIRTRKLLKNYSLKYLNRNLYIWW